MYPIGTDTRSNGGQCNQDGQCPCKVNVMGRRCDTCKESTFGLLYVGGQTEQHHHQQQLREQELFVDDGGCTPCFCFGRSSSCIQAQLVWSQVIQSDILVIRSRVHHVVPPQTFCHVWKHHGVGVDGAGNIRLLRACISETDPAVIECLKAVLFLFWKYYLVSITCWKSG